MAHSKRLWIPLFALALVIGLAASAHACATCGCGILPVKAAAATAAKAPGFTLEAHDGKKVSLSDFAGKIVVLEWLNWSCPFVVAHLKAGTTKALVEKYKDKGVVFLTINTTHNHDTAANKQHAEKWGVAVPVLNDQSGAAGRAYGARTTPDLRIIHKDGTIAYTGAYDNAPRGKVRGGGEKVNYVDKALEELLAGKSVSTPKTRPYGCSVKYAK